MCPLNTINIRSQQHHPQISSFGRLVHDHDHLSPSPFSPSPVPTILRHSSMIPIPTQSPSSYHSGSHYPTGCNPISNTAVPNIQCTTLTPPWESCCPQHACNILQSSLARSSRFPRAPMCSRELDIPSIQLNIQFCLIFCHVFVSDG